MKISFSSSLSGRLTSSRDVLDRERGKFGAEDSDSEQTVVIKSMILEKERLNQREWSLDLAERFENTIGCYYWRAESHPFFSIEVLRL